MSKKLIIILSVTVGLFIIWMIAVYMPEHSEIGKLKDRLASLEEMEHNQISENQVRRLKGVVDSLYLWVDESMKHIYPEEQLLDLGRVVENIGKNYGLTLISIVPDYESLSLFIEKTGEIAELPVLMQFRGRFQRLEQFLDDLAALPYVLRIAEVTIQKNSTDQNSSELEIMFRGVIILKKERTDEGEKEIEQVVKSGLI
ncbi:type 4a pilus biogenesis protein PilO [bacterium]|nr:type 4a pilus biogenesis protein PilO [bacterium]